MDKVYQKVVCGDCFKVMETMQGASVDVICTSPPYNIGIKYNNYNDDMEYQEYLNWMENFAKLIKTVLKDDGSFFLNIGGTNTNPWLPLDIANSMRKHFVLQNRIIWVKAISLDDNPDNSFGHYKPINSNRYLNNLYEDVFHFTKSGSINVDKLGVGLPYKWKCNRKNRTTGEIKPDKKCRGNTWFIPYETIQSKSQRFYHPAAFPVLLPERCIRLHGIKKGMVVLDPFLGVGSTLVACKRLSVNGIGIDMDRHYCEVSDKRLKSEENLFNGEQNEEDKISN